MGYIGWFLRWKAVYDKAHMFTIVFSILNHSLEFCFSVQKMYFFVLVFIFTVCDNLVCLQWGSHGIHGEILSFGFGNTCQELVNSPQWYSMIFTHEATSLLSFPLKNNFTHAFINFPNAHVVHVLGLFLNWELVGVVFQGMDAFRRSCELIGGKLMFMHHSCDFCSMFLAVTIYFSLWFNDKDS